MKKTLKKISIGVFALAAVCSLGGAIKTRCVQADAITNNTVETVAFQMEVGASIRLAEDGNGIRYRVKMPAAEYTALEQNETYSSVDYGILVAPADYEVKYGELNKENVFGIDKNGNSVTAKYDWAVKGEDGNLQYSGDGTKTRIMNFCTSALTEYTQSDGAEMCGYNGAIINIHPDNIVRNFVAVGYIRYTLSTGETDYLFAERNDNIRSMAEVARRAINSSDVDSNAKALLKEKYLENVYNPYLQFNTKGSKQIVKGAALSWDSVGGNNYAMSALVKHDDFDANGNSNEDKTTIGRQDLVIDMGGVYKVSEIRKVVIKYRYLNTSSASLHLYVNGIGVGKDTDADGTKRLSDMTYNGDGSNWYTPTATETFATLTIPQAGLKSNSLGASSILTDDDYLTTLTFALPTWRNAGVAKNYRAQIQIDSIEIVVPEFKAEHLEFNSFASEGIVEKGLNVQMVDLENDNKAVQATFKRDSSGNRTIFRINMGNKYKVSEIDKIEVSYKITAGNPNNWWYVYVSELDYTDNNLRLTGLGITAKGVTMPNFATFNISQDNLKKNDINKVQHTLLGDDDYLTAISFVTNQYGDSTTIQIDYIRIYLRNPAS